MKAILCALMCVCVMLLGVEAKAGTFMVGAKGWYAEWASATDKAISEVLADSLGYGHTSKPGTGYMLGPVFGYQTEDGRFSVSAALMVLDSFSQTNTYSSGGTTIGTKTEMDRKDYDLAASFLVLDWLKLYAGYKYTTANYDVNFSATGDDFYEIKYAGSIPTAGLAVAFPLSDMFVLGVQAGFLYVMPDYKWRVSTGEWTKLKADNSFGYSVEPMLSVRLFESFVIQCGVRYQIYSVKFSDPAFGVTKNDEFLGGTVAAIYLF